MDLVPLPREQWWNPARDLGGDEDEGPETPGQRTKQERELRRVHIAERLLAHVPYRTIAQELTDLGWPTSKSVVAREVDKIRVEWVERHQQAFDAHVQEELGKIDALERHVLPIAMHGGKDGNPSLGALDRAIALMDRKARLLGLDKPVKVETTITVDLEGERARGQQLVDELKAARERKAAGA